MVLNKSCHQVRIGNVWGCDCALNIRVVPFLPNLLVMISLWMVHLTEHLLYIGVEILSANIIVTFVIDLSDFVAAIFELRVVSILVTCTVNWIRQAASQAQTLNHCLREVASVSFHELLSHVCLHLLDIGHVVFHHHVFCCQVQLLFVAREDSRGCRSVRWLVEVFNVVVHSLLAVWVRRLVSLIVVIVFSQQLFVLGEIPFALRRGVAAAEGTDWGFAEKCRHVHQLLALVCCKAKHFFCLYN